MLRSQMPQEEKMKMSDYLVENSSDLPSLEVEAKKILKKLKALST